MGEPKMQVTLSDELSRCREWIEAALEYGGGTHEFSDVVESIYKGHMQLWPAEESCLVTELVNYPRKKVLHIFLGGGKLDEILGMHADVIQWAKAQGCDSLTMSGRKGWTKALKSHEWKDTLVVFEKRI